MGTTRRSCIGRSPSGETTTYGGRLSRSAATPRMAPDEDGEDRHHRKQAPARLFARPLRGLLELQAPSVINTQTWLAHHVIGPVLLLS
jgi:hypothetical protein